MYSDCTELYFLGRRVSGVYQIQPDLSDPFPVYCDMTDGGWTVFKNRFDGSQDFYLYWRDYKNGFGNLTREHWLGNDKLHYITQQSNYTMKMEVTYWKTGEKRYAIYDRFSLEGEKSKYRHHVSGYSGDTDRDYCKYHDQMLFSNRYQDNDGSLHSSCARNAKGGHWYNVCYRVHPTGPYKEYADAMSFWYNSQSIYLKQMKLKVKASNRNDRRNIKQL